MKNILLAFILTIGLTTIAKAQDKPLDMSEYRSHLYKPATLCDVIYEVKIISDTVTYLYAGGYHNNAKFTIDIKGNKIQLDWTNLKRKRVCVTGVLQLYKNNIQVIASEPNQIKVAK